MRKTGGIRAAGFLIKIKPMAEIEIKILKNPAGKFRLSYKVGQIIKIGIKQADEMVNADYAEYIKKPKITNRIKKILGL